MWELSLLLYRYDVFLNPFGGSGVAFFLVGSLPPVGLKAGEGVVPEGRESYSCTYYQTTVTGREPTSPPSAANLQAGLFFALPWNLEEFHGFALKNMQVYAYVYLYMIIFSAICFLLIYEKNLHDCH